MRSGALVAPGGTLSIVPSSYCHCVSVVNGSAIGVGYAQKIEMGCRFELCRAVEIYVGLLYKKRQGVETDPDSDNRR